MKKITLLAVAALFMISCSDDDSTTTNNTNPEGPQPKTEIIDWVSGSAASYGLNFNDDQLWLNDNSFFSMDLVLKITPKPGYENVSYVVSAQNYGVHNSWENVYNEAATGAFTGDFGVVANGHYIFNIYMSDKMEYDAELVMKPQNLVNPLPEKSAIGHERQD